MPTRSSALRRPASALILLIELIYEVRAYEL